MHSMMPFTCTILSPSGLHGSNRRMWSIHQWNNRSDRCCVADLQSSCIWMVDGRRVLQYHANLEAFLNGVGTRPITILSGSGITEGRKIVTSKPYSLGSCKRWSNRIALGFIWPCLPCLCGKLLSDLGNSLHGFGIYNDGYHESN